MSLRTTVGTCSLCGGEVAVPSMSVDRTPYCRKCGARPKRPHGSVIEMEPKSSPQIVDLAAALRGSLDRKGGAR